MAQKLLPSALMSESITKNLSDAVSENEPIEIDIGEEDNETNKEEESNSQKKGRRKTSDVWLYVKRVKVKENGEEAKDKKKIPFASASSITGTSAIEENYLKTISSGYNQNVVLNPRYERISRNIMRSDVMKVYESAKEEVKLLLKGTYRISLTSDLWTSNQNIGYMSLTAHFVDSDWTLQKRIINFCQLEPPHTGVAISDAIIDCLIAWGIEDKVSTITLDNASANDVAAKTIMNNFQVRDKLYFKGLIFHVRCCAHILNLVVQDEIHVIQDVIENIRCSVTYLKKSPSRENNRMNDISQLDKSDDLIGAKGSEGQAEFKNFLESTNAVEPLKSELEIYLEEQTTSLIDKFDALEWWRLNMLKFPILSKMARDILSVPITTVASESAFSVGGRVLNNFRSSLSSETVEALDEASF
ncbi:zinc finger BED domain-containing protein RICESLEEPER 2-like [Typha angustifolia]|uniref:zinc finger BED domain-containing protein RICESLEEPER 2-like n=1 Tax=Typha angustifolia TaxID=59011 RepID=UPI003C2CEC21